MRMPMHVPFRQHRAPMKGEKLRLFQLDLTVLTVFYGILLVTLPIFVSCLSVCLSLWVQGSYCGSHDSF